MRLKLDRGSIDLTGRIFGRLEVISKATSRFKDEKWLIYWLCRCSCGNYIEVYGTALKNGGSKSCGCLRKETGTCLIKHGIRYLPEYNIWAGMKDRCYNPNNKQFKNYGGRGIIICDRWISSPEIFINDMGYKPGRYYSIDRIDNNKGYSPDNCRWATRAQQNSNKSTSVKYTYRGLTMTIT